MPYGYHDRDQVDADLIAGGLAVESWDVVTMAVPAVARDTALGFTCSARRCGTSSPPAPPTSMPTVEAIADAVSSRFGAAAAPTRLSAVVVVARRQG